MPYALDQLALLFSTRMCSGYRRSSKEETTFKTMLKTMFKTILKTMFKIILKTTFKTMLKTIFKTMFKTISKQYAQLH